MKKIVGFILRYLFWAFLWLRYKIEIKGREKVNKEQLKNPGGILFLPNHTTVLVDPLATALAILGRCPIRPLVVEYMYYTPGIYFLMRFLNALAVPNFNTATNSIKRKRSEKVFEQVVSDLKQGDNFLIYPSGRIKRSAVEVVGGASALHNILQKAPEANIVLVRISGLWGSSFSRAITGQSPSLYETLLHGVKHVFCNFIFFTPRRKVVFEFEPMPADFLRTGSRLEVNSYLDKWYNQYANGVDPETNGEPLTLLPYSMWNNKLPEVHTLESSAEGNIDLNSISEEIKNDVIKKLSEIGDNSSVKILPEMQLATDLGFDSLDLAEVILFLQDKYEIKALSVDELDSVAKVMALAAHQITVNESSEDEQTKKLKTWKKDKKNRSRINIASGKSVAEVFFRSCALQKNKPACADDISGVISYSQLKMRALLLAEYIKNLPGDYVGILLPASVASYVTVLACQIAKKVPLMINWTVGPKHLQSVLELTKVQKIITSWSFVERLSNVNLEGVDDRLIMLEEVRREFTFMHKLKAFFRSKRSLGCLLRIYGLKEINEDDPCVLLFTSGTESTPKGVLLSHKNILTNLRAALELAEVFSDDVMLGILPPFHAFGFTVSGLMPLLAGMRVAFSPDPTEGKKLAKSVEKWSATMMCGAPTFLKGMLRSAKTPQLESLRFLVTGAEKAPQELYDLMEKHGKGGKLFEGYGITECSPVISLNCPNLPSQGVGHILPGMEVIAVHPENQTPITNSEEQGLLLVRGDNVFAGYLNKNIASPFVQCEGKSWYNTGDLAVISKEGYLTLSGRIKRFVKVGGEMVSLASIEESLNSMSEKYQWPKDEKGPSLAICANEQPGEKTKFFLFTTFDVDLDNVNKALREAGFSNLVRICAFKKLKEIPIMGSGKIHYRLLESEELPELISK